MQTKDKPFSLSYCSLSTLTSNVRVQAIAYWVHYACMFRSNPNPNPVISITTPNALNMSVAEVR